MKTNDVGGRFSEPEIILPETRELFERTKNLKKLRAGRVYRSRVSRFIFEIFFLSSSVAKNVGCFRQRLFVCGFVCQHDNFRTSKHTMMKLGG